MDGFLYCGLNEIEELTDGALLVVFIRVMTVLLDEGVLRLCM